MQVTIRQLRASTKEIMQAVERGEKVIVTSRGKKKAIIKPIIEEASPEVLDEVFGMWEDNEKVSSVEDFIKEQRKGRDLC